MKIRPINLDGVVIPGNVFLAPLAGYTNYPFRRLCSKFGADYCFTEMVSAKGLKFGSENTEKLLYTTAEENNVAVQIFGKEPDVMRAACESKELKNFSVVDINMGCPVPKIYKNGEGSALIENPYLAEKIVSECVKSRKKISVKFRIGITDKKMVTVDFAKRMEGAGASLITIHGRTRENFYSGDVHFDQIAKAKQSVNIPVIANGGVFSLSDGDKLINETGADGIMIARAALYDPQIFTDFKGIEKIDKKKMILQHLDLTSKVFDEHFTTVFMRKMASFYIKGMHNSAMYKEKLFSASNINELKEIINEILY